MRRRAASAAGPAAGWRAVAWARPTQQRDHCLGYFGGACRRCSRMSADTTREGFLKKNHAGADFGVASKRRYFVTIGFQVIYYANGDKRKATGHFDLRNVLSIAPAQSVAAGEGAVDLAIAEKGHASQKVLTISFTGVEQERAGWLRLWCSAILHVHVDETLKQHIDTALANELDNEYASQSALSRKNALFGSKAKTTEILTPRGGGASSGATTTPRGDAGAAAPAAAGSSAAEPPKTLVAAPSIPPQDLDTPRETPPGTPLEAPTEQRVEAEREPGALPPPQRLPPGGGSRCGGGGDV